MELGITSNSTCLCQEGNKKERPMSHVPRPKSQVPSPREIPSNVKRQTSSVERSLPITKHQSLLPASPCLPACPPKLQRRGVPASNGLVPNRTPVTNHQSLFTDFSPRLTFSVSLLSLPPSSLLPSSFPCRCDPWGCGHNDRLYITPRITEVNGTKAASSSRKAQALS